MNKRGDIEKWDQTKALSFQTGGTSEIPFRGSVHRQGMTLQLVKHISEWKEALGLLYTNPQIVTSFLSCFFWLRVKYIFLHYDCCCCCPSSSSLFFFFSLLLLLESVLPSHVLSLVCNTILIYNSIHPKTHKEQKIILKGQNQNSAKH